MIEKPTLDVDSDNEASASRQQERLLSSQIRHLINSQPFAVLCTQGEQNPYGSLVAFAMTDDLTKAVFATPITTRKFKLLSQSNRIALLIDNRCQHSGNMMNIEAVTVTGQARRILEDKEFECWSSLLTSRHGYLSSFVRSPSVALFCIEIVRYFHVERFQEVQQWIPGEMPG